MGSDPARICFSWYTYTPVQTFHNPWQKVFDHTKLSENIWIFKVLFYLSFYNFYFFIILFISLKLIGERRERVQRRIIKIDQQLVKSYYYVEKKFSITLDNTKSSENIWILKLQSIIITVETNRGSKEGLLKPLIIDRISNFLK